MLWQLPSNFHRNLGRLEGFARALRAWRRPRHAIELRHPSWFDEEVAACLRAHRIAVCQSDAADWPLWDAVTTDLVYVRLHGHERTYASGYPEAALRAWARKVRRWTGEGRDVLVYSTTMPAAMRRATPRGSSPWCPVGDDRAVQAALALPGEEHPLHLIPVGRGR